MPKKAAGTAKRATAKKTTRKKTTTRKRKTTATGPAAAQRPAGQLRVKQIRSGIGRAVTYRRTLRALGLKHHQDEVLVADNPSIRGMLHKVRHLVRVTAQGA